MKKPRILSAFLFILLIGGNAVAQGAEITLYLGVVTVQRSGKVVPLKHGDTLLTGDVVKTGPGSTADISFTDGSKIKVRENSQVRIGSVHVMGEGSLSVITGSIAGTFSKLSKGEKRISSSTVVCSIRGTEFTMEVDDAGDSRIDLKQGKVQLRNPFGVLTMVQGQRTETRVAAKPNPEKGEPVTEWLKKKNNEVRANPARKGDEYTEYLDGLQNRSDRAAQSIQTCRQSVREARTKEDLARAEGQISETAEFAEDDLILNENAQDNLDRFMSDFERKEPALYRRFDQLRSKSTIVFRQQIKNNEMLQKIRQEYQEAYDRIIGKFRQDKDGIRRMFEQQKKSSE